MYPDIYHLFTHISEHRWVDKISYIYQKYEEGILSHDHDFITEHVGEVKQSDY